ncbi:MAG: FCD domain-containing protein [Streptosporangiales bacterium]|nr:FCD domain-containing protein [Streptosporangiales bacterium]
MSQEPSVASWGAPSLGRVAAPLREQVTAVLRQAILDFDLKPGQRLVERELIEQLGVSRTTVREALRQLNVEGLVTVIPQKGAVVATPSPEDAADLYEVRAMLEAMTVRRFIARATDEHFGQLRAAFEDAVVAFADTENIRALLRAKDDIYAVLMAGAGSNPIQEILEGLQARVRALRATSLSQPGRPAQSIKELRRLVEAIEARDPERAAQVCTEHINKAAATGLSALTEES